MRVDNWNKRLNKQKMRELALQDIDNPRCSLWMPGICCADLSYALNNKIINNKSHLILVEQDRYTMSIIKRFCLANNLDNVVFHEGRLHQLTKLPKIDFAFIDLMGTLTFDLTCWLKNHFSQALTEQTTFCLTHNYALRNNVYLKEQMNFFAKHHPQFYADNLNSLNFDTTKNLTQDDLHSIVSPILILRSAFDNFDFKLDKICKYQDVINNTVGNSMMFYKLTDFQKHVSLMPNLNLHAKPHHNFQERIYMIKKENKQKRHLAAIKAHQTRRKIKQKRRQAALKAWRTRRSAA